MIRTEVVYRTDQIHPVVQCGDLSSQRTPAANQSRNPRPESGVQPLDVGGVDYPAALGLVQQGLDLGFYSLYHTSDHAYHLYLLQFAWLLYHVFVYLLAVLARSALPTQHGTLIQPKCHDNGLNRTAVGQQCHDSDHDVLRCSQSIEGCPFGFGKRLVAYIALIAPFLLAMHTDVAFANLSTYCFFCKFGQPQRGRSGVSFLMSSQQKQAATCHLLLHLG